MCRLFYLPRELSVVVITAVYLPPDANVSVPLLLLHDVITGQMQDYPEGTFLVAGDFNKACLKTLLLRFVQYEQGPTRGENILDRVYSNLKQAYRTVPLPHPGTSDHLSLLLVPAYTPLRRKTKPVVKSVKTWPEGALTQLQDCFKSTERSVFDHLELLERTDTVLSYIKHCTDTVTVGLS